MYVGVSSLGHYVVNLRLTETTAETDVQKLWFRYNELENNRITLSEMGLMPRNRASAVIVLSSR